ncbi:F-box/FBD/LRR-repeat protein At1g13570 [Lathyrus oleraceus]|uniref:F-box/FBD/LRR-repeat protein At1g13570 n=1 Tax=Pisum sativum TaxID=3888 RepID=UPI0021CEB061|nr:F-box/FBD/LRR-repeat protein At1g13570-like [Pisum sativum]
MKARKPSKSARPTVIDAEPEDRISCLPGLVIDQILSHLPIRHAVKTSALSKIWRYKWTTIPNLVFDRQCVSAASQQCPSQFASEFLTIIDHVLSLHSGLINKFVLFYEDPNTATDFDSCILYLSGRSIKELELEIWIWQRYNLPCCLFSCQSLHRLTLCRCCINPPSSFKDTFEILISGCPLLEDLTLTWFYGFPQVIIHAPNLKVFDITGGELESIIFENTFQLAKVTVDLNKFLYFESNQSSSHGCSSNLLNFFSHLPHLQSLEIRCCFLKYLAAGVVPVKFPTSCINLNYLRLSIRFKHLKEISAVLCLLRSSPNLRKIELYVSTHLVRFEFDFLS